MGTFEKVVRFFCACAPGIAIGLWLAPQLGFWWPLGAVVGATVSYLLVEWKVVVFAIPKAFKLATSSQPHRELWIARGIAVAGFFSIVSSCVCLFFGSAWLGAWFNNVTFGDVLRIFNNSGVGLTGHIVLIIFSVVVPEAVFLTFVLWLFVVLSLGLKIHPLGYFDGGDILEMAWDLIKFANPLAVFIYWPARGLWNLPRGVVWFCRDVVWATLLFCGRFSRAMLFIIHSRKRTLCATTTFMTVVLGYVVKGDLITFTLAGAAIGALYSISPLKEWVVVKLQAQSQSA